MLQYSLGRKKSTDPIMKGFVDYVCEVEAHGRWVIEAKGGAEKLSVKDAEQAHSYSYHPAVAGFFYLVTNGGLFRLYDRDPEKPILEWTLNDMDAMWPTISNLLSPQAIRDRARSYTVDVGKPLAPGLRSSAAIVGGYLTYDRHTADMADPPLVEHLKSLTGMRGTFTGRDVIRTDAGLIRAWVEIVGPYKEWDELNAAAGITGYEFNSAVEAISTEPDAPTIFQGTMMGRLKTGQQCRLPGGQVQRLPIGMIMRARTEAIGFVSGDRFKGTFRITYDYQVDDEQPVNLALIVGPQRAQIDMLLRIQPPHQVEALVRQLAPQTIAQLRLSSEGSFDMVLQ